MNRYLLAILAGIVLCAPAGWSGAVELPLTDDAFINGIKPDRNTGTWERIVVHNYGPKYGLVRFDAASIAGQEVSKATLTLYLNSLAVNGTLSVHAITSGWNESTVTWNNQPPAETTATAIVGLTTGDVGGVITIDVTDIVQRWADGSLADAGFLMVTRKDIRAVFDAKEKEMAGGTPAVLLVSTGQGEPMVTRIKVLDGAIAIGDTPPRDTFWETEVDIDEDVLGAAKSSHLGLWTTNNELGRVVINGEAVQLPWNDLTNQPGRWVPELGQTLVSIPLGFFRAGKNTIRFESGAGNWAVDNVYDDYSFGDVEIIFSLR
jgi:hypothetical protein